MPKSKKDKQGAARFEAYYALQHIVPDSEWPTFLEMLATPLPITFRITDATHDGHAAWLEAEAARLGATPKLSADLFATRSGPNGTTRRPSSIRANTRTRPGGEE